MIGKKSAKDVVGGGDPNQVMEAKTTLIVAVGAILEYFGVLWIVKRK